MNDTVQTAAEADARTGNGNGNPKRRKALTALAVLVLIAAIVWAGYEWLVASKYEDTDNAYVEGNVIQVTPQTGGTVIAIMTDDTDFVHAGVPLVRFDPTDAKVALAQADANLAQTVRQVRTLYANNGTLEAQIKLREADVVRAQSDLSRAADDLKRRESLAATGAVSKEELAHARVQVATARSALAAAQAGVVAAREQLASNESMTEGTTLEHHPSVQAAAAKVREAYLALQRTTIPAPVDGYVARRTVQLGQRIAPGTPLMSIVPLNQVWVDANFKEGQLRSIRIGQPVKMVADVYGGKVEYRGRVVGLAAGTGAAFALLPAQNATGNWIKVVQRVPVRIALEPKQLAAHPLRVGLSMEVTVDVGSKQGKTLADAPTDQTPAQTEVYAAQDDGANAEVRRVIAENAGRLAAPRGLGGAAPGHDAAAAARKAGHPAQSPTAAPPAMALN